MKNPTLVKNMKNVKWKEIPPIKGPDARGLIKEPKEDKQDLIFQNKYLILAACAFLLFIGFVAGRFSNSTKSVTPPKAPQ